MKTVKTETALTIMLLLVILGNQAMREENNVITIICGIGAFVWMIIAIVRFIKEITN